ncbi:MAG: NAD-dependent epimerase/dehydratase [Paucimonas sp.]|nr:NAD-dependent epimerase/dehydratase [Paucimonas sp.]
MNVVITGGAGFLGQRLARKLLQRGTLAGPDGVQQAIEKITLLDVVAATDFDDARIEVITGDIADEALLKQTITQETSSVFHLAAVVSGQAEKDFELGMRVNLDAARLVLEACRTAGNVPRVLFTSSVAVYGGELPATVLDTTALNPQSSYGIQKAIGEMLLADYSRKGFVDGRVARLPTISVRPGRPNQAASSFASGIIREPLNGQAAVCPVAGKTRLWLLSPRQAIDSLVAVQDLPAGALGKSRIVNLPGISVSVDDMVAALKKVGGEQAAEHITWQRDPAIERIVGSWPGAWDITRATALGLRADDSFEAIVRAYVEDDLPGPDRRDAPLQNV